MLKYNFRLLLVLGCGLVLTGVANAENRLSLSPGVMYFDYAERDDDGSFLDGETGPVFGVSANLEHNYNSSFSGAIFAGIYTGVVDYDGQTMAREPAHTDTQANFFNLGFEAKLPIENTFNDISLVAGYRFRRWERDIQWIGTTVSGVYEIYQWQEFALGAQLQTKEVDSRLWSFSFYAGLFKTHNAEMEINLVKDGYGKPKLSLGSDTGAELGLQWMKMNSYNQRTGLRFSYRTWRFGRSPTGAYPGPKGTLTIFEPRSKTSVLLVEFVIETPG